MEKEIGKPKNFFEDFSSKVTKAAGSTPAFIIALFTNCDMGYYRPILSFFRNMATGDQYGNNYYYLPDGFSHPEISE